MVLCSILPTAAGRAEMGLQRPAAAALRGREPLPLPQGEDRHPQGRHPARPDALRDPDEGPRHQARRRSSASRSSRSRPTSQNDADISVQIGTHQRAPAPARSSRWARAARPSRPPRTSGSSASTRCCCSRASTTARRSSRPARSSANASCSSRPACRSRTRSRPARPREAADAFLKLWREKHGDRDTNAGCARLGLDPCHRQGGRDRASRLEGPPCATRSRRSTGFQGAFAMFNFSPEQHVGITENPFTHRRRARRQAGRPATA